ncbi:hypothetical protein Lal_00044685 [Lupinus albus]|nr:hypothetical protein Lal_00044685 [Lupinus albus]
MPNTSGSRVHITYLPFLDDLSETFNYNWGSDKKEVGGCILLLQSWTYDNIPILAPKLHDNTLRYFPLVKMWSQHLTTTNILRHATNIIRGILSGPHIQV